MRAPSSELLQARRAGESILHGITPHARGVAGTRQNLVALGRDSHAVLEVRGERAILGHDGPAIVERHRLAAAQVHHGLDREDDAGAQHRATATLARAIVGHLGLLVHVASDAMAHVLAPEAQALLCDIVLYRTAHVV